MRSSLALACVVLAVWVAPAASAETTVLPERQGPPGVAFVDNPTIVDARPMPAESFSRVPGDHAVAVHFTTGTPECYGVHAVVTETTQAVSVELLSGSRPEAVGRACIMIAVSGTLEVPLGGPLGGRQVLSVW
ncbi:hypothetical protein [Mycolicibacterium tusciae]|uniref:hypothetical protein n=1 Tax=Mycolicibacterium tusciae TaxID=75922 RepID=UPI00024A15F9|nr:hypothetical protein [Mycolicibacterium tusciae]